MATSLTSPALVFASDKAILSTRKALAKVMQFATDFSADAVKPGTTLKIPVYDGGTAESFDASTANYEHVTGTLKYAAVTFANHVKSTFQFDDKDFLIGLDSSVWGKAGDAAGRALSKSIVSAVSALLSYDKAKAQVTSWSASKGGLAGLRASCAANDLDPADCVVMLKSVQFAAILAALDSNVYGGSEAIRRGVIEGLYGFKAVIENDDLPVASAADASKGAGAIVPADALVVAGRLVPVSSPSSYQETGTVTDEVSGLSFGVRRHGSAATGANFLTVEALFGAALTYAADAADKAPRFLQVCVA
jgi:hypothetical protein